MKDASLWFKCLVYNLLYNIYNCEHLHYDEPISCSYLQQLPIKLKGKSSFTITLIKKLLITTLPLIYICSFKNVLYNSLKLEKNNICEFHIY